MKILRSLVLVSWMWNLSVCQIVPDNYTFPLKPQVVVQECKNNDVPSNKAFVNLEINCDENMSAIRNEITILREAAIIEFNAIRHSLQTCSMEVISDIKELLSKDECAAGNGCSAKAKCIDGVLSYSCVCLPGYEGDGITCEDINECTTGTHNCNSRATCTNTIGSYNCRYRPPYSGNGYNCDDIECSSPAKMIEGLGCVLPVKERKLWNGARDYCQSIGYRLLEGITNKDQLNQLRHHFDGFFGFPGRIHDVWIGIKQNEWAEGPYTRVPAQLWNSGQPDDGQGTCGYIALQVSTPTLWDTNCGTYSIPFFCQALIE
ncbi:uncharacterized protein [Palaemon carinicauda]|uniref:uncharacterized protein n=1 Tax=Palaemon carinicauda TaxID=392227 RepID=UPI0035B5B2E8